MNHLFQYCTSIEIFDTQFPDNSPTIINIQYFIMHCRINDYTTNCLDLMNQDKETFGATNYICLESRYWDLIIQERQDAVPEPGSQQLNTTATNSYSSLPKTGFHQLNITQITNSRTAGSGELNIYKTQQRNPKYRVPPETNINALDGRPYHQKTSADTLLSEAANQGPLGADSGSYLSLFDPPPPRIFTQGKDQVPPDCIKLIHNDDTTIQINTLIPSTPPLKYKFKHAVPITNPTSK